MMRRPGAGIRVRDEISACLMSIRSIDDKKNTRPSLSAVNVSSNLAGRMELVVWNRTISGIWAR